MTDSILALNNVRTYYGDALILDGVSFSVPRGNCVAVLGRNGVGKTTLSRTVIGFTPPRTGTITFEGAGINGLASPDIVKRGIAIVPQGRRVFGSLTVYENLAIAARSGDVPAGATRWDLQKVFDLFPRLHERRQQRANTLSGGEQQMIAIGRALMTCPKLLLLDESTEGLAPIIIEGVVKALGELRREGVSMLLFEQRVEVALRLADVAIAMTSHGVITFNGPPAEFPTHEVGTAPP